MKAKDVKAHPLYREINDIWYARKRRFDKVHFPQYYGHEPRKPESLAWRWRSWRSVALTHLKNENFTAIQYMFDAVNPYSGYLGGDGYRAEAITWHIYNGDYLNIK